MRIQASLGSIAQSWRRALTCIGQVFSLTSVSKSMDAPHRQIAGIGAEVRASVLAILLLATIGLFDYVTTSEVALGVLYFAPVALAAWKVNRTAALLVAFFATAIWHLVEQFAAPPHSSPWVDVWNAAARAISFVTIALLVSALCEKQKRQLAINDRLTQALAESERAGARIKELQSELQMICSWTNRIRSEGRWMRFEEFLQRNFDLIISHGISEEAAKRINDEITRTLDAAEEDPGPGAPEALT